MSKTSRLLIFSVFINAVFLAQAAPALSMIGDDGDGNCGLCGWGAEPAPRERVEVISLQGDDDDDATPPLRLEVTSLEHTNGAQIDVEAFGAGIEEKDRSIQGCLLFFGDAADFEQDINIDIAVERGDDSGEISAVEFDEEQKEVLPSDFRTCLSRVITSMDAPMPAANDEETVAYLELIIQIVGD